MSEQTSSRRGRLKTPGAFQQAHPPLKEFGVMEALARSSAKHWTEPIAMSLDRPGQARPDVGGLGELASAFPQPAPEHRVTA